MCPEMSLFPVPATNKFMRLLAVYVEWIGSQRLNFTLQPYQVFIATNTMAVTGYAWLKWRHGQQNPQAVQQVNSQVFTWSIPAAPQQLQHHHQYHDAQQTPPPLTHLQSKQISLSLCCTQASMHIMITSFDGAKDCMMQSKAWPLQIACHECCDCGQPHQFKEGFCLLGQRCEQQRRFPALARLGQRRKADKFVCLSSHAAPAAWASPVAASLIASCLVRLVKSPAQKKSAGAPRPFCKSRN